ncbi:MAG: hypothetical protein K0R14_1320 [Burkholderiales bacterium]|jgi:predicted MFS family arabinose efflux permease|nr:hypothetical protein [Burkholderiales bacterium]
MIVKIKDKTFVYICLMAACLYFSRVAITFLPVHLHNIGQNKWVIGLSTAMFGSGYFLGSYLLKHFKLARKKALLLAYLLVLSCFTEMLFNNWLLLPLCFMLGTGFGFIFANINLLVLKDANNRLTVSIYRIFLNIGAASALFTYSLLVAQYNIILILSIIMALCGVLFSIRLDFKSSNHLDLSTNKAPIKNSFFKIMFVEKRLLLFCLFDLIINTLYSQFYLAYPIYLKTVYHVSITNFGIMSLISVISIILLEYPITKIFVNANWQIVFYGGAFLICISQGLLPFGHTQLYAYIVFFLYVLGEIIYFPASSFMPKQLCTDPKNLDIWVSYSSSISGASIITAPIFFSLIYGTLDINYIWYTSLAIGVLCLFTFIVYNWRPKVPI